MTIGPLLAAGTVAATAIFYCAAANGRRIEAAPRGALAQGLAQRVEGIFLQMAVGVGRLVGAAQARFEGTRHPDAAVAAAGPPVLESNEQNNSISMILSQLPRETAELILAALRTVNTLHRGAFFGAETLDAFEEAAQSNPEMLDLPLSKDTQLGKEMTKILAALPAEAARDLLDRLQHVNLATSYKLYGLPTHVQFSRAAITTPDETAAKKSLVKAARAEASAAATN